MRNNLDPVQHHNNEEICEKVPFGWDIKTRSEDFDVQVSEEGENWSPGFCLARTLLHTRKILVLDEASASIDSATDSIIKHCRKKQMNAQSSMLLIG
ncbi:hypothetical protein Peur_068895 [Populus x canadensis]